MKMNCGSSFIRKYIYIFFCGETYIYIAVLMYTLLYITQLDKIIIHDRAKKSQKIDDH